MVADDSDAEDDDAADEFQPLNLQGPDQREGGKRKRKSKDGETPAATTSKQPRRSSATKRSDKKKQKDSKGKKSRRSKSALRASNSDDSDDESGSADEDDDEEDSYGDDEGDGGSSLRKGKGKSIDELSEPETDEETAAQRTAHEPWKTEQSKPLVEWLKKHMDEGWWVSVAWARSNPQKRSWLEEARYRFLFKTEDGKWALARGCWRCEDDQVPCVPVPGKKACENCQEKKGFCGRRLTSEYERMNPTLRR